MSVVAIMLVKDEADIIATTVGHLLGQVDAIHVYDNGSTDGTREILDAMQKGSPEGWRMKVADDPELGYYQSQKMSRYARLAGELGHEWVVPCDADEIWYSPHGSVKDMLGALGAVEIAQAELFDHVATAADPNEPNPVLRIGWRRLEKGGLPKVACRIKPGLVIEQGNHGAHYPGSVMTVGSVLNIRHFPYRSPGQMVSKVRNGAAAYAATNLPLDFGRHWRDYGDLLASGGEDAIGDVFRTWFWSADPTVDPTLIFDPAPL